MWKPRVKTVLAERAVTYSESNAVSGAKEGLMNGWLLLHPPSACLLPHFHLSWEILLKRKKSELWNLQTKLGKYIFPVKENSSWPHAENLCPKIFIQPLQTLERWCLLKYGHSIPVGYSRGVPWVLHPIRWGLQCPMQGEGSTIFSVITAVTMLYVWPHWHCRCPTENTLSIEPVEVKERNLEGASRLVQGLWEALSFSQGCTETREKVYVHWAESLHLWAGQ